MDETTAKVDKLICGIMDLAYEEPDHANEFIFAFTSKLCLYAVCYHVNYLMRNEMAKTLGSIENKSSNTNVRIDPNTDSMLYSILRDKEKL